MGAPHFGKRFNVGFCRLSKKGEKRVKSAAVIFLAALLIGLFLPGCSTGRINELETQVAEQQAQIAALNSEIAKLEKENASLEEEYEKLQKDYWLLMDLRRKVEAKDARIAELEEENAKLQEENAKLQEENDDLKEEIVGIAKIKISFWPNPAPYNYENKQWEWRMLLREVNGVGVRLNRRIREYYTSSALIGSHEEDMNLHLDPYGVSRGPCSASYNGTQPNYVVLTYIGVDDHGHRITAKGRVDFEQP